MITSTANEKVKFVKKLHDKKNRDAENLFIAEGVNILSDLKEGFSVKEIFATDKTADIAENLAKKYGACSLFSNKSFVFKYFISDFLFCQYKFIYIKHNFYKIDIFHLIQRLEIPILFT